MSNNRFEDMPALMKEQVSNGKKDKYIEISECMTGTDWKNLSDRDKKEYLEALRQILDCMDFQIYELYRAMADRFLEVLRYLFAAENSKDTDTGDEAASVGAENAADSVNNESRDINNYETYLDWGEKKHLLLKEWFIPNEYRKISVDGMAPLQLNIIFVSPRSMTFEITGGGKYCTDEEYIVYINGNEYECGNTVVRSVFGLIPEREYELTVIDKAGTKAGRTRFVTKHESVTLNVRDFGAAGDGITDDTNCIQTAIFNAPKDARVLVPEGTYLIRNLYLLSNMQLEISRGAVLLGIPDRTCHGVLPAMLPSTDGKSEYNFGTWEGNPLPMMSGILGGCGIQNVSIYGEGTLDGGASKENWWKNPKEMKNGYRPRLFFISGCKHIYMQGLTLKNSPAWTIHPYFSDNLGFYNVNVRNPYDSPNTDGLDPESCSGVEIAGVSFSLGDDCIAIKSGKIYLGRKYKKPSENIRIHNCLMENGHGSVTVGSEMAGGAKNITVEDCVFSHTDRGLRIKTRRGRGRDAVLDEIVFKNIKMDNVMTPFVVNSFYFCDPDGKTSYVQSRELFPVDERTPIIKKLEFDNIEAENCHVAAAYIEGLPELKIEELVMHNIRVSYAENPKCGVPAMSEGVETCSRKGIFAKNVKHVILDNVEISGCDGEAIMLEGVDSISRN